MSERFNFKYSAPDEEERKEINNIRQRYLPQKQTESKFEKLKRLDAKVKNSAIILSLSFGIAGCLIFGLGLTMFLEWNLKTPGIFTGLIGVISMIFAYPSYKYTLNRGKQKYGEEILSLSNDLLNDFDEKKQ